MPANWYMTRDGTTKYGPYDDDQLKELAASGRILPTDMLWKEGMGQWVSAASISGLSVVPPAPPMPPPPVAQSKESQGGNKIAAGLCGILLGAFGIHKFILGLTTPGIIMLLVSILTCVGFIPMAIIGLVEGIIYLTKTDEEFYRIYVVEKKGWF